MEDGRTKKNLAIIFLLAVVVALSVIAYSFQQQKGDLRKHCEDMQKDAIEQLERLNSTIEDYSEANLKLRDSFMILNKSYEELFERYKQLNSSYEEVRDSNIDLMMSLQEAFEKIDTYQREIDSSLEWFSKNSQLGDKPEIKQKLESKCIKDCSIKLGCIFLVNERMGFSYKSDLETTGDSDRLKSLNEFVEYGGGDCEDFSLFFKAEYNYLKSKCDEVTLESYKGTEEDKEYFLDFNEEWYMSGVEPVNIGNEFQHANVVCGKIYDLNRDNLEGHCIVGFTKEKIETVKELKALETAHLVEPQNGKYYGMLNRESSGIYLQEKDLEHKSFVSLIITDNDLFLYSETEEEWLSHSLFKEQLDELKTKIEKV